MKLIKIVHLKQNEKQANIDFATATETKADGEQRARVKEAMGIKQSRILEAEGQAQAIETVAKANAEQIKVIAEADAERIKLVNTAAKTYFEGNAVELKKYEVTQASLENNSKVIVTKDGINPVIVLGEDKNIVPIPKKN